MYVAKALDNERIYTTYYEIVLRFFSFCVISMASNYLFNYETIERQIVYLVDAFVISN